MKKNKAVKVIRDYVIILISAFIYAIAFVCFFDPNEISMGGFTGIAQIINHYFPGIPVGATVLVLNIPLFAAGIKYQGLKLLWYSISAIVISSVFIDIIPLFVMMEPMQDNLLACVIGGAILGLSLGLMLLVGATTGGTELAASLLKRKFVHIQIGRICLAIDIIVIILYALAFHNIYNAMYAGIALFISSVMMDAVIYGRRNSKVAYIICNNSQEITQGLLAEDLGITKIEAKGGFSNDNKNLLICAFRPNRISAVKRIVTECDPKAFVIICDAKDVFGEGFLEFDNGGL